MKPDGESSNKIGCHQERRHGRAWMNLRNASIVSIVIHLCAGLVMLLVLRQGLDTNPDLTSRLTFLVESRTQWVLAWLVWNAAALSILYFYFCFVRAHHRWSDTHRLANSKNTGLSVMHYALALSTAAVALDLAAEGIQMGVLPGIALTYLQQDARLPEAASLKALFEATSGTSTMLTGCMANFLYTVTATILLISTRNRYGTVTLLSGGLLAVSGVWLSVACILNSVSNMFWSNAVLLPTLLVWQMTIALDAGKRCREESTASEPEAMNR